MVVEYAAASGSFNYVPPRQYSLLNGDVLSIAFSEYLLDGVTGRANVNISWATGAVTGANVLVSINGGPAVRYTVSDNSLNVQAYTNDIIDVTVQPTALVHLKASAKAKSGHYTVQGLLEPLPTPANVTSVYREQLTHIIWSRVNDLRLVEYEVRLGAEWQSAIRVTVTPITDTVAVGDGQYWIATRYRLPGGTVLYSVPASIIIAGATLVRNVVALHEEAPAWPGVCEGGAAINVGTLVLAGSGNILGEVDVLADPNVLEYGGISPSGSYTFPVAHQVNIGRVAPCQLITKWLVRGIRSTDNILVALDVFGMRDVLGDALGKAVSAKPQIAIAQADGVWSDWKDFLPGVYNGQRFTARMLLTSSDTTIHPSVEQFSFAVDVPDRLDTGTNVPVSASGLTVTFTSPFNAGPDGENQPHVQVTLLGAHTGDLVVITSVTVSGFTVQVLNGPTPVVRNINWSAQGY